ncbi:hypothetical protein [Pseudorhodoferax sp.]|uniref:hypothetical protein n=1 Tax=Pseudorhodoferax sp. TaxID=1993553 RepID=UPI002DD6A03B|nr:hypothetical protein [Pseudorhodoferax sp.]
MNAIVGWGLAVLAVAAGYAAYGWPGVLLALTVVVFWMLLQFSRAMRVMRVASSRPVGSIGNAVMLHTRLQPGMRLLQILPLTQSLGQKVADDPETFVWTDEGGDSVRVELRGGRVSAVALQRAPVPAAEAEPATPPAT